jgi:DNA polymerase-3 subunit epsilon
MLSSGFPSKMVLLDCETTGGKASRDRLTEIALIKVENGEVTERWQTLINPGVRIPPWISKITGIDDAMVANAPSFDEIAETLQAKLAGCVLVAHNARFDYSFIRQSFARCGIDFLSKTLCSVRLSRSLYPQHKRHGLDHIIKRLGVNVSSRHRAMDDTKVIEQFFQQISTDFSAEQIQQACQGLLKQVTLPSHLDPALINDLPRSPGVYHFYDEAGKLLYIGKSVNIKERVLSHFSQSLREQKSLDINQRLHHIDYELTPSDFGAQLLENEQIKHHSPPFNQRQKKIRKLHQLRVKEDKDGYSTLEITDTDMSQPAEITGRYGLFRSRKQAEKKILQLVNEHQLCQQLCGLEKVRRGSCFNFQLKKCRGACCGEESAAKYNLRVQLALQQLKNITWPWSHPLLVVERGRQQDDDHVLYHLVDQWVYLGKAKLQDDIEALLDAATPDSRHFDLDGYKILLRFLMNPRLQQLNGLQIHPYKAGNYMDGL